MPNGNASYAQMRAGSMGGPDFSSFKQTAGANPQTVNPHMAQTSTSVGRAMSWRSEGGIQSGQGTLLDFGNQPRPQGS